MQLIDAHNHLHDERLDDVRGQVFSECERLGVVHAVVNGTHPNDWARVRELAARTPWILPSYGCHPWFLDNLPSDWITQLEEFLSSGPSAVGEIGLDHWKEGLDRELQEEVFLAQLKIAIDRNLPVSIHGLHAWERLAELLRKFGVPAVGFLLHSYSGPAHLVPVFEELGGYFSCPPSFLAASRHNRFSLFGQIMQERILAETDAPDQAPASEIDTYGLQSRGGARLNHPASIDLVYQGFSELLERSRSDVETLLMQNFYRLFGGILPKKE